MYHYVFDHNIHFIYTEPSNHSRRISFSVYVKSNVLTLGAGQTIKYDAILRNDGNGYDNRTGVFTCPVAGTYMFVVDFFIQTWGLVVPESQQQCGRQTSSVCCT